MFATKLITAFAIAASVASAAPAPAKRDTSGSGTATYYSAGLGACGWTNSDSDYVVAVNSAQYSESICGKTVSITNSNNGNTATATVADECPTCSSGDLDMSTSLFSSLNDADMDAGEFSISWSISN